VEVEGASRVGWQAGPHRRNVDEYLDVLAPEKMLIERFKSEGSGPWNFNGFGNNDPGQQRDTTRVKQDHFDAKYPADLDVVVNGIDPGRYLVGELAGKMKAALPYVFRYATRGKKPHDDLSARHVEIDAEHAPSDYLFASIADVLPGWQITALPGYVIRTPRAGPIRALAGCTDTSPPAVG
jgi:hypothetical protein